MATATVMQGIWSMLQSLSLTNSNKRWLADKLIVSIPEKKKTYSKEDQAILDGFREAVHELKEIKAGRAKTVPDDIAMVQLRKELEEEGYEFD